MAGPTDGLLKAVRDVGMTRLRERVGEDGASELGLPAPPSNSLPRTPPICRGPVLSPLLPLAGPAQLGSQDPMPGLGRLLPLQHILRHACFRPEMPPEAPVSLGGAVGGVG